MSSRFKKRKRFVSLPKHKRNDHYINLKNRIKRDSSIYSDLFWSNLVIDESEDSRWCDFYFLGLDKFTIWNATICNAELALQDEVYDMAHTQAISMLTEEEQEEEFKIEFVPADRSSTGKVLTYLMVDRERIPYEKFGGLTFSEQVEKIESDIITNAPPNIYESFITDRSYSYGIGLSIVMDVEVIHRKQIEQAILKFREIGEKNWQGEKQVSFK